MRAASGWNQAGNGVQPVGWTADPDFPAHAGPRAPLVQIRSTVRLNRPEFLFYLRPQFRAAFQPRRARPRLLLVRELGMVGRRAHHSGALFFIRRRVRRIFASLGCPNGYPLAEAEAIGPWLVRALHRTLRARSGAPGGALVGLLPPGPCFLESPVKSTLPH